MVRRLAAIALLLALAPPLHAAAPPAAEAEAQSFTRADLGLTVLGFTADLPAGRWEVAAVEPKGTLEQAFVAPADPGGPRAALPGGQRRPSSEEPPTSRRLRLHQQRQRTESARYQVQELAGRYRRYAERHGGSGPGSLAEIKADEAAAREEEEARRAERDEREGRTRPKREARPAPKQEPEPSPWHEDAGKGIAGPYHFVVPGVAVPKEAEMRWPAPSSGGEPIVLELRPYVDDGRHWVAFSNGRVERVPADAALLARQGLALSFVVARGEAEPPPPQPAPHTVLALLRDPAAAEVAVTLRDRSTGGTALLRTRPSRAAPGKPELLAAWAAARIRAFAPWIVAGESRLMTAWAARSAQLYGAAERGFGDEFAGMRDPTRTTDAFAVLGGRAALRETLQLELMRGGRQGAAAPQDAATIPIATVAGVEVKSHPFEEMLAGAPGGRLPLADAVPADRFFAHFAKPAALFPFLEDGGEFLFRAGSLFTRSSVDDDLAQRYLRRLGLDGKLGRRFLESGEVSEVALTAPDLFFLDGTDVTVLMRVKHPGKLPGRLRDFGVVDLAPGGIAEKATAGGGRSFWALRDDLLVVSSSRAELDGVLALGAAGGAGSLGRSAEFRSMLAKLPPGKQTRAYLYFSDPFIRRMVGPAVKIGQLRRLRARAAMELATAGALLWRLDGGEGKPDLGNLVKLGYVPPAPATAGVVLRDDFVAESPVWGTAAELAGLGAAPVETVTPSEAEAYRRFVEEYARYWRQYFDPVAIRLDDAPGGDLELEVFILPLLESQVYDQVRALLPPPGEGAPLRVPSVTPEPVLLLSLNLAEDAWVKAAGGMRELFTRYTGLDPRLLDLLGPGLHLALQDGDPIVVLGNADILGGLSGPAFTEGLMRQGIPLLLSVLTRPCKIVVELKDEQAALDLLRRASSTSGPRSREAVFELRRVSGRDAWVWSAGIAGIVKVRLGIEVQSGYLVVSNIPWSQPVAVGREVVPGLGGARLLVAPGAVRLGLPGLHATDGEQSQLAALRGMGALYPLLLTVAATPGEAADRHAALFGSRPLHPGPGSWVWKDGRLASSAYGTTGAWEQPAWSPDLGDFGLFRGIDRIAVSMQLEGDGLRARTRWSWRGKD